jgi:hypothetical protein
MTQNRVEGIIYWFQKAPHVPLRMGRVQTIPN